MIPFINKRSSINIQLMESNEACESFILRLDEDMMKWTMDEWILNLVWIQREDELSDTKEWFGLIESMLVRIDESETWEIFKSDNFSSMWWLDEEGLKLDEGRMNLDGILMWRVDTDIEIGEDIGCYIILLVVLLILHN